MYLDKFKMDKFKDTYFTLEYDGIVHWSSIIVQRH
jgi:hypothetical protein